METGNQGKIQLSKNKQKFNILEKYRLRPEKKGKLANYTKNFQLYSDIINDVIKNQVQYSFQFSKFSTNQKAQQLNQTLPQTLTQRAHPHKKQLSKLSQNQTNKNLNNSSTNNNIHQKNANKINKKLKFYKNLQLHTQHPQYQRLYSQTTQQKNQQIKFYQNQHINLSERQRIQKDIERFTKNKHQNSISSGDCSTHGYNPLVQNTCLRMLKYNQTRIDPYHHQAHGMGKKRIKSNKSQNQAKSNRKQNSSLNMLLLSKMKMMKKFTNDDCQKNNKKCQNKDLSSSIITMDKENNIPLNIDTLQKEHLNMSHKLPLIPINHTSRTTSNNHHKLQQQILLKPHHKKNYTSRQQKQSSFSNLLQMQNMSYLKCYQSRNKGSIENKGKMNHIITMGRREVMKRRGSNVVVGEMGVNGTVLR